jgi:thiol-disulfide isomerase/thioredoxin
MLFDTCTNTICQANRVGGSIVEARVVSNEKRECFSDGSQHHIERYNLNMQLNELAPDFELPDLQGIPHKLSMYCGKIVLINFWSAECPHSERTDHVLNALLENWDGEVIWLSIAPNRNESVQMVAEAAKRRQIPQVLVDSEHLVADLYEAVTTPHVFVLDREGILRYRGAVDNVTFRRRDGTHFFLKEAVEALLQGELPTLRETPPYGCAIVREI